MELNGLACSPESVVASVASPSPSFYFLEMRITLTFIGSEIMFAKGPDTFTNIKADLFIHLVILEQGIFETQTQRGLVTRPSDEYQDEISCRAESYQPHATVEAWGESGEQLLALGLSLGPQNQGKGEAGLDRCAHIACAFG